jgi:DNA-binding PadR family transcriptional regulator
MPGNDEARPLNPTAASLLGFLHEGPMSGWDLVATAQQRIGDFWTLTRSQVYRELAAMADAGLVKAGKTGARERTPYKITAAGRKAFTRWLHSEPGLEQIRFPLLLTMAFAQHLPPERLREYLAAHRAAHAERLAGYEAQQQPGDPFQRATLDFGIRYERAVLEWFDALGT